MIYIFFLITKNIKNSEEINNNMEVVYLWSFSKACLESIKI